MRMFVCLVCVGHAPWHSCFKDGALLHRLVTRVFQFNNIGSIHEQKPNTFTFTFTHTLLALIVIIIIMIINTQGFFGCLCIQLVQTQTFELFFQTEIVTGHLV